MKRFLTVEAVRLSVLDQSPEDNTVTMSLYFTEEEILSAMELCALAFNELPPIGVGSITAPNYLPHTEWALHGVRHQLYLSRLARMQRNRVEYTAGNMVADPDRSAVEFLSNALSMHRDEFRKGAHAHKMSINVRRGYGGPF